MAVTVVTRVARSSVGMLLTRQNRAILCAWRMNPQITCNILRLPSSMSLTNLTVLYSCNGGYPRAAWTYFRSTGLVTGGQYNTHQGCRPYTIEACEHHVNGSLPPCGSKIQPTPKCARKCEAGYTKSYDDDKHYGKWTGWMLLHYTHMYWCVLRNINMRLYSILFLGAATSQIVGINLPDRQKCPFQILS